MCRALGMSEDLIGKEDFDCGRSGHCCKSSDRVIISVTRAILHDADILMISSALDVLGERLAGRVLRRLRMYVREKGLPGNQLPEDCRHDKTVIYVSKYKMLWQEATRIICPEDDEIELLDDKIMRAVL